MAAILITNGGPHPPEAWAVATAEELLPIDNNIEAGRRVQALKLQAAVADALIDAHKRVAEREQQKLASGDDHFESEHEVEEEDVESSLEAVREAASGTPWADHAEQPEVERNWRRILHNHYVTHQHVLRLWHADRNPGSEAGKRYKARYHGGEVAPQTEN